MVWLVGLVSFASAHTDVTAQQAKDMIDADANLIVVDVREAFEYCDVNGHIGGALNYPSISGVLEQRYEELPIDGEILVYCRSGFRSNLAAEFLDSKGFLYVYDMLGGFLAWEWETAACVDSDGDGFNDDLDNCPADHNPGQADSDGDGIGNFCDGDCPNLDGANPVSFIDFSILAYNWRRRGGGLEGDLNADLVVDEDDVLMLAEHWLSHCYGE
jgi:rhodanese-related sulfurtransferase